MKFSCPATVLLVTTVLLLSGCAGSTMKDAAELANQSAVDAGSPYRWEHHRSGDYDILAKKTVGVVADTTADDMLAGFTRKQIAAIENTRLISPEQEPSEVRIVYASDSNAREVWVYEFDKATQAFVVDFITSANGGTDVNITGPW